jgi:hypothetical protein
MNDLTAWIQINWYALGNLIVQFAFLAAAVWFARKILRTLRASQEQFGALLKLTLGGAISDRHTANPIPDRPSTAVSPYWLAPEVTPPIIEPPQQQQEIGPGHLAITWRRMLAWLQAPMLSTQPGPWDRTIKWLQSPAST